MSDIVKKRLCKYSVQIVLPKNERESEEDKGYFLKEGTAFFHQWALEAQADDDGTQLNFGIVTVAIVEDCETGKVYTVNPNEIKFINT